MKYIIHILFLTLIISACSEADLSKREYKLVELESYSFRRSYQNQNDSISEEELDAFMKRNPESHGRYEDSEDHPLYDQLIEHKLVVDGNLNLSQIDTLPDQFYYQAFEKEFRVETKSLMYQAGADSSTYAGYELNIKDEQEIILTDTMSYLFPTGVTFFIRDLNDDGKDELLVIYQWYFIIGDNYDLKIYGLE